MITPLIVLSSLAIPLLVSRVLSKHLNRVTSEIGGVAGIAIAFAFFGIGHFAQTESMSEMLPEWVPARVPIIYFTGLFEWLLAAGLLTSRFRRLAAWACIATLVAFFPANIYAAVNSLGTGGHQWEPIYLLIRAPLQLLLISWTCWFAIRGQRHGNGYSRFSLV